MATWAYSLAGADLNDFRAQIVGVDGLEGMPARRGSNPVVPYRHGTYTKARKWYGPRMGVLNVRVFDRNASGAVSDGDGQWAHAEDNLDRLKGFFYSNNTISIVKTTADAATTRTLDVEFLGDAVVRQLDPSRGVFDVSATFEAADPFWYEAAGTSSLGTVTAAATATVSVGGNAPVADMVYTFVNTSAVGLTMQVDGDRTLTFAGTASGTVVVDCGARTIRDQAGAALAEVCEWDGGYWGEFSAGVTNNVVFGLTSGTSIVTVVHEDKWF